MTLPCGRAAHGPTRWRAWTYKTTATWSFTMSGIQLASPRTHLSLPTVAEEPCAERFAVAVTLGAESAIAAALGAGRVVRAEPLRKHPPATGCSRPGRTSVNSRAGGVLVVAGRRRIVNVTRGDERHRADADFGRYFKIGTLPQSTSDSVESMRKCEPVEWRSAWNSSRG